jgi:hypothetical protein
MRYMSANSVMKKEKKKEMKEFKDLEFAKTDMGNVVAGLMFENNYGISVVMGPYTKGGLEGKFEIAVLKMPPGKEFSVITYDTPIADDVVGHLTQEQVSEYIAKIEQLPILE